MAADCWGSVWRRCRTPLLGSGSFDIDPMRGILRIAAERDLAVLVHPMQLPRPEWSSYYLANFIGNPTETATAAASLVLGGVLEELPHLRICMLHGGGCAPALVGRWQHGWQQRADVRSAETRTPIRHGTCSAAGSPPQRWHRHGCPGSQCTPVLEPGRTKCPRLTAPTKCVVSRLTDGCRRADRIYRVLDDPRRK